MLSVNGASGTVQGTSPGTATVNLMISIIGEPAVRSDSITVSEVQPLSVVQLDPIVAILRLNLNSAPPTRLRSGGVSLDVLSELSYFRETVEVTASAVLDDGRRVVITNPNELLIGTSNTSVVSLDRNYVVAEKMGTTELTVIWATCGSPISMETITVTVNLDQFRPIFNPEIQQGSVPENSPAGHLITIVEASDQDSAGDIQYRFQDPSYSYGGLFVLDPISGRVTVGGQLDREVRDSYVIVVEATDRQQRLAEQAARRVDGGDDGSALERLSGSGSGERGMLVPDREEDNTTIPLDPPATLMVCVSRSVTCYHNLAFQYTIAISCNQLQSITISCNQLQSVAISYNQLQSVSVSCNHICSVAITFVQLQSQYSLYFSPY